MPLLRDQIEGPQGELATAFTAQEEEEESGEWRAGVEGLEDSVRRQCAFRHSIVPPTASSGQKQEEGRNGGGKARQRSRASPVASGARDCRQ